MARNVDVICHTCGKELFDQMLGVDDVVTCTCGAAMDQIWWQARRAPAQWDDCTAVMVHVNHDPNCPDDVRVRYPGRHDAKLKPGYERVYLRSLAEVDRFERDHHVLNHVMHYDSNGRAHDDYDFRGRKLT